jgi:hypothetical protein
MSKSLQATTHPVGAPLDGPLFGFAGKRAGETFLLLSSIFKSPLCGEAEERVTKRSNGRVSRLND